MITNNDRFPRHVVTLLFIVFLSSPYFQPALGEVSPPSARVQIGSALWGDYPCVSGSDAPVTENLPIMKRKCDVMIAVPSASGGKCVGSPPTQSYELGVTLSPSIDSGGTGCEIEEIKDPETGDLLAYRISNPKRSGVVTVTAKAMGGTCAPQNCNAVTPTAIGTIQVEVPDDDDECTSCQGNDNSSFANGEVINSSTPDSPLNVEVKLGRSDAQTSAGTLLFTASAPSVDLAQPNLLSTPFTRAGVNVITNGGSIRQVLTPQGLVNVKVQSSYEYHLQCFYRTNVTGPSGGLYGSNAPAFVTWIVKNPDGASASNRLWVIENRGGTERLFAFNFGVSNRLDLIKPDGVTTNTTWLTVNPTNSAITNLFREVRSPAGLVAKKQITEEYVPALGGSRPLHEIEGDGGTIRTTTYTYYSPSTGDGSSNKVRRVDYPDGNWVYYVYDAQGRKLTEYSAYGNSAPPGSVTTEPVPEDVGCKMTQYTYALTNEVDGIDDGGDPDDPWSVRKTIMSLPVQAGTNWQLREVSRTYHYSHQASSIYYDETQVCPMPGGLWGDPGNLITINTRHDTADFKQGLPASESRPDGTATVYSYELNETTGVMTTTMQTGVPNSWISPSFMTAGTETVTVTDEFGNVTSRTQKDIYTEVVLARETYNYLTATNTLIDQLKRSYDVTDLAGRVTQYRYANCCGVDYTIDPDGVQTYRLRDDLNRSVGTRRVVEIAGGNERSITTTNLLDAAGRILATYRVGTNGSIITLGRYQYDVLGQMLRHTNALGGVTMSTNVIVDNRICTTNTAPDGGTTVELFYRDGRLERTIGTAVFPMLYTYGVEEDIVDGPNREYVRELKLNTDGSATEEWTKTYQDGAGRNYKTVFADDGSPNEANNPYTETFFNAKGQLARQRDQDGVITLFQYNALGEQEYVAIDVNPGDTDYNSSTLDYTIDLSHDRITRTERKVLLEDAPDNSHGEDIIRTEVSTWPTPGSDTPVVLSWADVSTNGLRTWQTIFPDATDSDSGVTSRTETTIATSGNYWKRTVVQTRPDSTTLTTVYSSGRLESVTSKDSGDGQVGKTTYGYDPHARQNTMTDARNGTTTFTFNDADLTASVTTPDPGSLGGSPQTTLNSYNPSLQATNVVQPDDTSVTSEYYPNGLLKRQYGSRTYPVAYTYDYAGRLKSMTNWASFVGGTGARATLWNYNAYRGWLDNKRYADNTGPAYAYTGAGRLKTRTWARGITTSYGYNSAGGLVWTDYSDGTADVTNGYDRRGRLIATTNGTVACNLAYDDANQLLSENFLNGTLGGLAVTNAYDTYLRRSVVALSNQPSTLVRYGYNTAGRLSSVSNGNYNVIYAYHTNSPLVNTVTFRTNSTTRMVTTKLYDRLDRLTSISSTPSADGSISYSYQSNDANQRTRAGLQDSSFWVYEYDVLGQVKSGKRYWNDWTPVAGQQFEYSHDDIGNRTQTKSGGDENGWNLRMASYYANNLNQYTNREVPGYVDIKGISLATNIVTVNSETAYRHGDYFRKELVVGNGSAALWTNIIVAATGQTSVTGNVFVAQSPEAFSYDGDGNLTNDGRWSYTWDAENRLVQVESLSGSPTLSKRKVVWEFDGNGRRIRQTTSDKSLGSYVVTEDLKFVSDGWQHLAELNATNDALVRSYVWGLDLSGSTAGAGGVGGLLMLNSAANGVHFYAYDGNGNVVGMVKGTDGTVSASYEYGPFGETIRSTGTLAGENRFQFSTKRCDATTDFLLYEYRMLRTDTGKWVSRDPIEERGGENLYGFVENSVGDEWDLLGLCGCTCKSVKITFEPGGDKQPKPDFYPVPVPVAPGIVDEDWRFGFRIIVSWTVDGDPNACKYYLKEAPGGVKGENPSGKVSPSDGSLGEDGTFGGWQRVGQTVTDYMGIPVNKPGTKGKYKIEFSISQDYKCLSSDGTTQPIFSNKSFKGNGSKKWTGQPPTKKK